MLRRFGGSSFGALAALLLVGAAGAGSSALAQDPAALVDQRQAEMKKLGGAMKTISQFVKGEAGTVDEVRKAATVLAEVHGGMDKLWWEGTAEGVGDSEAKANIWTEREKFNAAMEASEVQSAELVTVAAAGDKAAIGQQLGKVGAACKACHQDYKAD